MKSERRRNARVNVEIPVMMRNTEADANMRVTCIDLSEGRHGGQDADFRRKPGPDAGTLRSLCPERRLRWN